MTTEEVSARLSVQNRAGFQRDMGAAATSVDRVEDQIKQAGGAAATTTRRLGVMGRMGSATGNMLRTGLAAGLRAIRTALYAATAAAIGWGVYSVKAASSQGEAINAATVTFEKSSKSVIKWSRTTARSLGIARTAALTAASGFGNMLQTSGVLPSKAALMSRSLVKLASDMASLHDQDPNEMLDKLRSGLAGEAEPLRRFAILLSAERQQHEAVALGIAKQNEELTAAQKIQANYSIILKDARKAHGQNIKSMTDLDKISRRVLKTQGDFANTSGSLANRERILGALFEDLSAKLGKKLLPAANRLLKWGIKHLPGMVAKVVRALKWLTDEANSWKVKSALGLAAGAPLLVGLGRVAFGLGKVLGLYKKIRAAWAGATAAGAVGQLQLFGGAGGAAAGGGLATAGAIGGIAAAGAAMVYTWNKAHKAALDAQAAQHENLLAAIPLMNAYAENTERGAHSTEDLARMLEGQVRAARAAGASTEELAWITDRAEYLMSRYGHSIKITTEELRSLGRIEADLGSTSAANLAGRPGAISGRARGGRVRAGEAYLVGETRPEVIVPNFAGAVIPRVAYIDGGRDDEQTARSAQGDRRLPPIEIPVMLDGREIARAVWNETENEAARL